MNGMERLGMRVNLLLSMAALCLAVNSHAASFDCAKATTNVETAICADGELSKLDEALGKAYSEALSKAPDSELLKQQQKQWLRERNKCEMVEDKPTCLRYQYRKRSIELQQLSTSLSESTVSSKKVGSGKPKGEFFLSRVNDNTIKLCQDFTRNLNQFRYLDFGECNPRLSSKYPQFSRPEWEEIPFDLAIAEKVIKDSWSDPTSQWAKDGWQKWLKWSEPLRQTSQIYLWQTRIDFDGDGKKETIYRLFPQMSKEERYYPKPPYGCDYVIGGMYMLEEQTIDPEVVKSFNREYVLDIIYDYASDKYYTVYWNPNGPAMGVILPVGPRLDIGATNGVTLKHIVPVLDSMHMSTDCLIDWVLTDDFKPSKHTLKLTP